MNEKWKNFFRHCFQIGTPECAVFFSVAAMVLALLFLTIGFWQTLLVAALVALGAFLGGVKDKKEWVRGAVNKLFPPKQNIPFRETRRDLDDVLQNAQEQHTQDKE